MVASCCAFGCTNRIGDKPGLALYRFPADKDRRKKWISAIRRDDWQPSEYSRLCSAHFISGKKSNHPLSPDFIPSVFSFVSSPEKHRKRKTAEHFHRTQSRKRRVLEHGRRKVAATALLGLCNTGQEQEAMDRLTEGVDGENTDFIQPCDSEHMSSKCVQTVETMEDIQAVYNECKNLREEKMNLKKQQQESLVLDVEPTIDVLFSLPSQKKKTRLRNVHIEHF